MDAFVTWVRATTLSQGINHSTWIWPLCETLHFIGLSLLMGTAGFFDLRLMGFMKRVPVSAALELMPFAVAGFLLNLATGLVFLIALPEHYAYNLAFYFKVGFLALAGLNALLFNLLVSSRVVNLGAGDNTPVLAKAIGFLSLVSWFGVLYWGRMLPFIGDAY
jgi:hypothetical protein